MLIPTEGFAAAAGRVILSNGQFYAMSANQQQRTLNRGSEIYAGETLVTGENASAQVRFTDNSIISLAANTQYRVDSYRYQPSAPGKGSYSASILKGGVKTLTGKIAKDKPGNYSVKGPVATIGVRGTFYAVTVNGRQQATTTWQGTVAMKTATGTINLGPSHPFSSATADSVNQQPQGSASEPDALVSSLNEKGFGLQQRGSQSNILLVVPSFVQLQEPLNPMNENLFQPTRLNNQIDFNERMLTPPS